MYSESEQRLILIPAVHMGVLGVVVTEAYETRHAVTVASRKYPFTLS
jgi:hypothetical protein